MKRNQIPMSMGMDGPFTVSQLRAGDRYELKNGHPIYCSPAGARHAQAESAGHLALSTDPLVKEIGIDVGYTLGEKSLRAPDIAIGNVPDAPGFVAGAPRLAVEYADRGQDQADLRDKIRELLLAGTEQVWVVRLAGPIRVEVYTSDAVRTFTAGEFIAAPGILQNPVPVEALYRMDTATDAALDNLLAAQGHKSLRELRAEAEARGREEGKAAGIQEGKAAGIQEGKAAGIQEGKAAGIQEGKAAGIQEGKAAGIQEGAQAGRLEGLRLSVRTLCAARGFTLSPAQEAALAAEANPEALVALVVEALRVPDAASLLG